MSNAEFNPVPVRPCVKCGATDRCKKGDCKPCKKIRAAKWYEKNRDVIRKRCSDWYANNTEQAKSLALARRCADGQREKAAQKSAKWRENNPEKLKAYREAWYAANAQKVKILNAAYYAANPNVAKLAWQNRRAKKQASGGVLSKGLAPKLFKLQKGKCACCEQPLGENYHLDHIMPLALGGSNTDSNIQLLHQRCNNQKSKKHPVDFMQSRGFLL